MADSLKPYRSLDSAGLTYPNEFGIPANVELFAEALDQMAKDDGDLNNPNLDVAELIHVAEKIRVWNGSTQRGSDRICQEWLDPHQRCSIWSRVMMSQLRGEYDSMCSVLEQGLPED